MKSESSFIKNSLVMVIAVAVGVFAVVAFVGAATTISTNIATDGTLLVNNATSTVTNLSMITSTSTSATSTSLFATRFTATNATSTSLAISGLAQFTGGILANNATSTITWLDMAFSTSTSATSTSLFATRFVTTDATTTSLSIGGRAAVGTVFSVAATSSLATTTVNRFLAVGSTTPEHNTADVLIDGAATTTLQLSTSLGTAGACIQMKNSQCGNTRIYVNVAGTGLTVEAGVCK